MRRTRDSSAYFFSIPCRASALLALAALLPVVACAQGQAQAQPAGYATALQAGRQAFRAGKFDEAAASYDRAAKLATPGPNRADALTSEGQALWMLRRYAQSLAACLKATQQPKLAGFQRRAAWQGVVRVACDAEDLAASKAAGQAVADAPTGDVREADRASALAHQGDLLVARGDSPGALTVWRHLFDLYPRQPAARFACQRLVEIYIAQKKPDQIRTLLDAARKARVVYAEDLYVTAIEGLTQSGDAKDAAKLGDDLLAWRPMSAMGWHAVWPAHRKLGDADAFLKRALAAAAKNPGHAEGLQALADLLGGSMLQQDWAAALALYQKLLEAQPNNGRLLYGAAEVALKLNRLADADRWSEEDVKREPREPSTLTLRGRVLARLNRTGEAVALLKQAAHYRPEDVLSAQRLTGMLDAADLQDAVPGIVAEVRKATGNQAALASIMADSYRADGKWGPAVKELAAAVRAGESSPSFAAANLRRWLADPTSGRDVAAALDQLVATFTLPPGLAPARLYALAMLGHADEIKKCLAPLSPSQRGQAALQAAQWLEWAGRDDLAAPLYKAVLASRIDPSMETRIALRVADRLIDQGRPDEARRLLEAHHKPAMPVQVAAPYDLTLARLQLKAGEIDQAEALLRPLAAHPVGVDPREVAYLQAEAAFRRGDYDGATRRLADVHARPAPRVMAPPLPPTLGGATQGVPGQPPVVVIGPGRELIGAPVGASETTAEAMFLTAEIALRKGDLDGARYAYLGLIKTQPMSPLATQAVGRLSLVAALQGLSKDDRRQALDGLRALDAGKADRARELWAQWINDATSSLGANLRLLLAEALEAVDAGKAADALEEFVAALPDSPLSPYALYRAAQLRAPSEPAVAMRIARSVAVKYPDSAMVPLAQQLAEELSIR